MAKIKRQRIFKNYSTVEAKKQALADMKPFERTILKSEKVIRQIKNFKPIIIQI